MRLQDLIKPISKMSPEELRAHVEGMRYRRTVERPAARAREERADKKEVRRKVSAFERSLEALSPEDRAKLIAQLTGETDGVQGQG